MGPETRPVVSPFHFPLQSDFTTLPNQNSNVCTHGGCHESPPSPQTFGTRFFSDLAPQARLIASTGFSSYKPVIAQVSPFLKNEEVSSNSTPQPSASTTSSSSGIPAEQAQAFQAKGQEFLNLAHRPGLRPEEQLNHFHTALFNFQMLGDNAACHSILQDMLALYERSGNEFGKSYAQAQLSFLKGNEAGFTEAIRAYEQMDRSLLAGISGLDRSQVDSIRGDIRNKLMIAYMTRGQFYASQGQHQKATLDLEQALLINPSKPLFQLYAQEAYRSGLFDFRNHDDQLEALRIQRNFLPGEEMRGSCNSHHKSPSSRYEVEARRERLHIHQSEVDARRSAISLQSEKNLEKFRQMLALAYPDATSADRYERDTVAAEFLEQFGRSAEAMSIYGRVMEERKGNNDTDEILRYANAANRLAANALNSSPANARNYVRQSLDRLAKLPSNAESKFLISQARFIEAESYLKEGNLDEGRSILTDLKLNTPLGEANSLQFQLTGRIWVRLAQAYYSRKDTFFMGDVLAEEIKIKFKGQAEMVGDTFFAKALSRVGTGKALEAIRILREEVQRPYPQSSAAQAIASDSRFQRFLTTYVDAKGQTQQVLKEASEINEADWMEAFKVAVAKSGEGSTERKVGYAAAGGGGVLAALAFAPEPVATKAAAVLVGIGMGIGLLWERFVSASEHTDEIYDAYRTGISTITDSQNATNMFLLGADVAMLLTAGMAGSIAKAFAREALAVGAEQVTSTLVLRSGITVAGDDVMIWAGRGVLFAAEHSATGLASYSAYQIQKSIFFRQEFQWNASEALQWIAMGAVIDGAARLPIFGTAAAQHPFFQRGPLQDILVNGKVVGQTTREGLMAKWLVDASVGLSIYYALAKPGENYSDFLTHNIFMMGVLHGGGALARKMTGGAPEAFISRIDRRANERFARARDQFDNFEPPSFGFQPLYALAGGGVSTFKPSSISSNPRTKGPLFLPMFMMSQGSAPHLEQMVEGFRGEASTSRMSNKVREQEARESVRKQLMADADWRRVCKGDFSFLDALSGEQLLAMEAILKVGISKTQTSGNTPLLYRMQETGFLTNHVLKLSPESLRAFAMVSGKSSNGRDFAQRLFYDYLESNAATRSRTTTAARESGILFESIFDTRTNTSRTRLDMVLEAYFWMEASGVKGARDVIEGVTGEFHDAHRVRDPNIQNGWRSRGWREVQSENEWRGNIDEAIRMGQLARENVWRPNHADALAESDSFLGDITYSTVNNGRATDPLQPDGFTRGAWGEEYKSTYHNARPSNFSTTHMSAPEKFFNQVLKYGQAVKNGILNGVTYRITAASIDPAVIAYIEANIPNVRVLRYDSAGDTNGTLVFEQHKQATGFPISVAEAQGRALSSQYPFTAENGSFTSYRLPEQREISPTASAQFRDRLLLYTETLNNQSTSNPELTHRVHQRSGIHIEWLVRVYERMPAARRALIDAKIDALTRELDAKLPQLRTEDARAQLVYSSMENLAREVIVTELPVSERVPLRLSGNSIRDGQADTVVNSPLDYIPGQLKLYLTDSQIRGPYQRMALRNQLRLSRGTRIYTTDLSPQEAHASQALQGVRQGETSHNHVLGFDANLNFRNETLFEAKVDAQGRSYYELKQDYVLGKGDYQLQYHGQNPKVDFFAPLRAVQ